MVEQWAVAEAPSPACTATRSIESAAAVASVGGLLADPTHIPRWAPAFADSISGDTVSGRRVSKAGRVFSLRVVVNHDSGTVDYLREVAPGREGGAYIRVTPRPGGGSVIVMTLPFLPDVDPADTATTLARELIALVSLIEGR